jgi:glycosyltransferase involved in cell wall biosynthesis
VDVRVLHDGSFIRPGGSARVARELAKAFDAPVTVGHTVDPGFWSGVDATFPFQSEFHHGLTGRLYERIPKHYAEFRVGQRYRELEFDERLLLSTSTMSKWVVPRYDQRHVNYCHVPPPHFYALPKRGVADWAKSTGLSMLDQHFSRFVDRILANSEFTRQRVQRHYRTDAPVLNPPVRVDKFYNAAPADPPYFVMICRLVPMKRVELVAEAFATSDTGARLVVVGNGPLQERVARYPNVEVQAGLSDEAVEELVAESVGGVAFAELEHCGLTPKEFQAAGKPVIVPDEPNLCNHVVDGETGVVTPVSVGGLEAGIRRVLESEWDVESIRTAAEPWSRDAFRERARELLADFVESGTPEG